MVAQRPRAVLLLLLGLLARPAAPSMITCARVAAAGTTFESAAALQESPSASIRLAKADGEEIPCGGQIAAGASGLTLSVSGVAIGSTYNAEAVASFAHDSPDVGYSICCPQFYDAYLTSFTFDGVAKSVYCNRQRPVDNRDSQPFTVPPSGSVAVRVAWQTTEGRAYVSPSCTYTVASIGPPPPAPPPGDAGGGGEGGNDANASPENGVRVRLEYVI
jgi:hypothetical protein